MRLLFATAAAPLGLVWPELTDEQLVCGPLHLDLDLNGQVFSRRSPAGDYDLAALIAALPADQQPDAVACVVDHRTADWPVNLAACPGPRLLLVGEVSADPTALARLITYARRESFDRIIFTHGEFAEAHFRAAGLGSTYWFPGLLCSVYDGWLPIIRQSERTPHVLVPLADHARQSVINRHLAALDQAKLPAVTLSAHAEYRLEQMGRALITLVPSGSGDWSPAFFETLAAGGLLVTGGPGCSDACARLWPQGAPCALADDPAAAVVRLTAWLDAPATADALRTAGAAWYDRFLAAAPRRAAFMALVLAGRPAVPAEPSVAAITPEPEPRAAAVWAPLEAGDYARALEEAQAEVARHPQATDGHLILADLFAETGAHAGFGKHLTLARQLDPHDPRRAALRRRCSAGGAAVAARKTAHFWRPGADPAATLAELTPLLEKFPALLPLHVLHAHLLTRTGQCGPAIDAWFRATRHHPNEDALWFSLGLALWRADRRSEAGFALRRAADHAPQVSAYARAWASARRAEPALPGYADRGRDLVITGSENCQKHGAGVLIKRCFSPHADTVTLRPATFYEGLEEVGGTHLCLPFEEITPAELQTRLRRLLAPYTIRRILCVPFNREECLYAIAAQAVTGAPLCSYVMDDRNILVPANDDHVLAELFRVSSLRLAISSELQMAYAIKYDHVFEVLPPIVTDRAARRQNRWTPKLRPAMHAALVGSVWTAGQLQQLVRFVARSGLTLDWFGRPPSQDFAAAGINALGFVPENELADRLTEYPFVVVPSGTLDGTEGNEWLTRLSLPSRIVFLLQTQTPVLVLGSPQTCASRHVAHLGIGRVMPYHHPDPAKLIREFTLPAARAGYLASAARAADGFVMPDAGRWIWDSLEAGAVQSAPFHAHMARQPEFEIIWPPSAAGPLPLEPEPAAAL